MTEDVITVRGLSKSFGGKPVVNGIRLSVRKGEIMGFLGPNGSGKTTTIRLLCGLLDPDDGEGIVLGHDIRRERDAIKRKVGYMTQRFSLYADLTITENLALVARLYGMTPVRRVVRDTLRELGLLERKDQLAGALSGGWKQRLALAACVMHRPALLMLDEPTAGVDPKARREFWDRIHMLAHGGLTVLVSTHYMDEAERCHRIAYISDGKLLATGTVAEVVRNAGLSTMVLSGAGLAEAEKALRGAPGVEQIAPFGATLHVVGSDSTALRQSVARIAAQTGSHAAPADTSLEDVFIQLMGSPQVNTQDTAP